MSKTFNDKTFGSKTFGNKSFSNKLLLELNPLTVSFLSFLNPLPSEAKILYYDNIMNNAVDLGLDTKLDRLWIFSAENEQNASISLFHPWSNPITTVNSPTFTANVGYTGFNGTNQYLNSNFIPFVDGVHYSQNSASIGFYSLTDVQEDSALWGVTNTSRLTYLYPYYLTDAVTANWYYTINASVDEYDNNQTTSLGLHSLRRTASNATQYYIDGVEFATGTEASVATSSRPIFIGAHNNNGTAVEFGTRGISYGFIGDGTFSHQSIIDLFA